MKKTYTDHRYTNDNCHDCFDRTHLSLCDDRTRSSAFSVESEWQSW